jgi:tetratricopeptide (TPR) repeat protein
VSSEALAPGCRRRVTPAGEEEINVSHDDGSFGSDYERAWQLAEAAKESGSLQSALIHYTASLAAAEREGDEELVDRAFCNRAALAIALGKEEDPLPRLRAILLRNRSQVNAFLAANTIARACELRREHGKGLFYARIAKERAAALGRAEWLATASNQIANLLLAESNFEHAAATYREALALVPDNGGPRQLAYTVNLGYCELVLGHFPLGLSRLYGCLRTARRNRWTRLESAARIDLCYGNLELGRYEAAERHGRRGLALAETIGESDWIKNALYLLGEVAVLAGSTSRGYAWFHELQRRFYPTQPGLPDLLLSVDIRKLINLRA